MNTNSRHILVVGNGAAGLSAVKAARAQNPEAHIILFGKDNHLPYYRLRLCEYIGKPVNYSELEVTNEEWFKKNRIQVELSAKVTAVDAKAGKISVNGRDYSYDSLILATGSTPFMPPFKGKELSGIHSIWTWEDIAEINKCLANAKKAIVIGGGLLGLEAAYKISELGINVSLIEGQTRLLPKQLDEEGSEVFRGKVESLGVSLYCGKSVTGFEGDGSGHVKRVCMADGTVLEADVVIVSAGVRPNIAEFQNSGIEMDRFIKVNERMETSIENIYAAGDVASVNGRWFGQWSVASRQGQVAGTNAAGGNALYKVADVPYVLATMGTRVVSSGDPGIVQSDNSAEACKTDRRIEKEKHSYSKLVFRDGLFVGYMLVGEPAKSFSKLQSLLNTSADAETIYQILYK